MIRENLKKVEKVDEAVESDERRTTLTELREEELSLKNRLTYHHN